jgi:hypothetical protein
MVRHSGFLQQSSGPLADLLFTCPRLSYYHVWLLDKKYEYLKYMYATIAIWGFERVVRWAMLAWYNLPALRKSDRKLKNSFAAEG